MTTRINTNVSSLIAQRHLTNSNGSLQEALTRLSTGLRINVGADDPAGLIASENLRRDITAIEKAIANTERATQLISTADSALDEVSGILKDIRGLVTDSANTGVLSSEQIAANQLQVDASLDAINRIAQVTTFQGRRILDGSLGFLTTAIPATVVDHNINVANLGATGSIAVDIDISAGATQAQLTVGTAAFAGPGLVDDLVVQISGKTGSEVFTFETGATLDQIVNAVNLVQDATGVEATNNAGVLELDSTGYGSESFVDVDVISETGVGTFGANLSAIRDTGTDIVALVNGVSASGNGNTLSVNTATLDLSLTVTDGDSTDVNFTINGGGAVFQLGPNVVSNQQVQVGIASLNVGRLGGVNGRLYELRSGGTRALGTDPNGAALIVDEVINKVTTQRGRLGALVRTTLQTNVNSLNTTLVNLSEAESSIRDADFAKETAKLTRAQILVQAGTSVLTIANQNPQNVLGLLR